MGKNSKIEWCDDTVNLWWGCSKVHAGCKNCYAEYLSDVRHKNDLWGEKMPRKRIKSAFKMLEKIQKEAKRDNVMRRVFVGSMMDIFEDSKPLTENPHAQMSVTRKVDELATWEGPLEIKCYDSVLMSVAPSTGQLRQFLFDLIKDGYFPNIEFLFLTKRPWNINKLIPEAWKDRAPHNVMFGCSVSDQDTFNDYMVHMSAVRARRFLSVEPQLEMILPQMVRGWYQHIDWVIVGGESGKARRPFDLAWAYEWKRQCEAWRVPFFFKQIDKVNKNIPEDLRVRQFPKYCECTYTQACRKCGHLKDIEPELWDLIDKTK